ncbi:major capsid protein [Pseudomonas nitroreducens]|uniref:major capsid protein n=1 Tax=Pseudomonas nitroreducens TaxID=46680 RepID=UPI0002F1B5C7|nr:major capsid protein [Pseudomonas nitroreducens]
MADIAVFDDEAFSVANLTHAINDIPYVPGRIAKLGLFVEEGVTTTTVQIEKDGDTLVLVPSAERGSSGLVVNGSKRDLIPFNTVHLPQRWTILADEVQGIRAFGSQTELQAVEAVVNARLEKCRRQLDATHEYQRMGALNGLVLDADGSRVLCNIFNRFGVQQIEVSLGLADANADVRENVTAALDQQEDVLGALTPNSVLGIAGRQFWGKFIKHKSVRETYLNSQQAAALRGDARESFEFGGVTWERYRGKINGIPFIAEDEALLIPLGVPELCATAFAPADYMETANTQGLPYYGRQERLPFGKGIAGEVQSNPLHIVTRPRSILRLKL